MQGEYFAKMEGDVNCEIMDVVSWFKNLSRYFSKDRSPRSVVTYIYMRLGEKLNIFGAVKTMCLVMSVGLVSKREWHEIKWCPRDVWSKN